MPNDTQRRHLRHGLESCGMHFVRVCGSPSRKGIILSHTFPYFPLSTSPDKLPSSSFTILPSTLLAELGSVGSRPVVKRISLQGKTRAGHGNPPPNDVAYDAHLCHPCHPFCHDHQGLSFCILGGLERKTGNCAIDWMIQPLLPLHDMHDMVPPSREAYPW